MAATSSGSESLRFSNADFQCLQDQLVELRTSNYNLNDANRRYTSDLELAKTKIGQLQRQLEDQERDFQKTTGTLRLEIETLICERDEQLRPQIDCLTQELTAKQVEYEESVAQIEAFREKCLQVERNLEQLHADNKQLKIQLSDSEESNVKLVQEYDEKLRQLQSEQQLKLNEHRSKYEKQIDNLNEQCETYCKELEQLRSEASKFDATIAEQIEERKINEKKGLRIVKELKRQLIAEQHRAETLQQRLQEALNNSDSQVVTPLSHDCATTERSLSTSSITAGSANNGGSNIGGSGGASGEQSNSGAGNGQGAGGGNGNGADSSSVGSWSFMPNQASQSVNTNMNESISLCSISDSEDRDAVQISSENLSSESLAAQPSPVIATGSSDNSGGSSANSGGSSADCSPTRYTDLSTDKLMQSADITLPTSASSVPITATAFSLSEFPDEHAVLVDRLTRLQQENWKLEEKLNYLESSNLSLSQDLINKSEIIRHYCMESGRIQGGCASKTSTHYPPSATDLRSFDSNSGSLSSTTTIGVLPSPKATMSFDPIGNSGSLNDKIKGVKKVVDFIKDRSGHNDSEHMRDLTRKMQLTLEETLTKNIHLQRNLDILSEELAKLKANS